MDTIQSLWIFFAYKPSNSIKREFSKNECDIFWHYCTADLLQWHGLSVAMHYW